ncbi:MAG: hypothetical protein NUV78_01610 [Candidatus Zambryskibacteria bacterium]|nr:hypothetical protein [Candidatus Zambryskibacteria bacterium]
MTQEKNFKIEKVEKLPDSEAQILGEISLDFLTKCRKDALKHLNAHLDLPGFRKGMVPEDILVKTVGAGAVLEETAEVALGREYGNILKESELKPITRPEIKITKLAPGIPLEFQITVATVPEFALPDYKKIASEVKETEADKKQAAILEALVKETKLELPKRFIDSESAHMMEHFKQDVDKAGIKWEEYLDKVKKTEDEVRESFKGQVTYRAKAELIIGKIAEKKGLKTYGDVFTFLEKK